MVGDGWTRRGFLRRAGAMGAVAIGGPVVLGACGVGDGGGGANGRAAATFEEAKKTKNIKLGFANLAPWAFMDENGELTGYAPTVARAVLKKLGIDNVEGEVTEWDSLIDNLRAKKYAMVAAGMAPTPDRCKTSDFAIPDVKSGFTFLVPKGNPKNITKFEDIVRAKVTIATISGGTTAGYLEEAVPKNLIRAMQKNDDIIRAVRGKDVYGALVTEAEGNWTVKELPDAGLEVTEAFDPPNDPPEVGTFNFRKGDDGFREAFNRELIELHKSGEWLKLVEPFGMTKRQDTYPGLATQEALDKYCGRA